MARLYRIHSKPTPRTVARLLVELADPVRVCIIASDLEAQRQAEPLAELIGRVVARALRAGGAA